MISTVLPSYNAPAMTDSIFLSTLFPFPLYYFILAYTHDEVWNIVLSSHLIGEFSSDQKNSVASPHLWKKFLGTLSITSGAGLWSQSLPTPRNDPKKIPEITP